MFTKSIKQSAKLAIKRNARGRYLPGILLVIIPFIIYFQAQHCIKGFGATVTFIINIILLAILQYLGVWFSVFGTRIARERVGIRSTVPDKSLLKSVIIPIIIIGILLSGLNSYGYMLNGFVRGICGMISFIIPIYLILIVISYVLEEGSINHKRVLKAFPEYLWRFLVLVIIFIPLGLLIAITSGILGFWKATYISVSFRVLGIVTYKKYSEYEKVPTKHLIGGLIVIALFVMIGFELNTTAPVYRATYKVTAYDGQVYSFVTKNDEISSITFDTMGVRCTKPVGIQKNIIINGQQSGMYGVFNNKGELLGISLGSNGGDIGNTNINEIINGAKSYTKGPNFSLISIDIYAPSNDNTFKGETEK